MLIGMYLKLSDKKRDKICISYGANTIVFFLNDTFKCLSKFGYCLKQRRILHRIYVPDILQEDLEPTFSQIFC